MRYGPAGLLVALLLGLLGPGGAADAQQPTNVPRVGFFRPAPPSPEAARILEAFKQGLREQGYVDGENIVVEVRFPKTTADSLPDIAAELVRLKPHAIFAAASSGITAVRSATTTIPIVALDLETDPLASGIVASQIARVRTSPEFFLISPSWVASGWSWSRRWPPGSLAWPFSGIPPPGESR